MSTDSLVFDDEINEMTAAFEPLLLDQEYTVWSDFAHATLKEVPYGDYRTDVVAVRFRLDKLARRKNCLGHYKPLPDERKCRKSYRRLQKLEPVTKHEWVVEDYTYIEETAKQTWKWLNENDYIRQCDSKSWGSLQADNGRYVTTRYPDVATVTAYELKQKDWEKALLQASRAQHYAENCIVVMDAGGADDALDNQHRFRNMGVGLWVLDEDGYEKIVTAQSKSTLRTTTRQLVIERSLDQANESVFEKARQYE